MRDSSSRPDSGGGNGRPPSLVSRQMLVLIARFKPVCTRRWPRCQAQAVLGQSLLSFEIPSSSPPPLGVEALRGATVCYFPRGPTPGA